MGARRRCAASTTGSASASTSTSTTPTPRRRPPTPSRWSTDLTGDPPVRRTTPLVRRPSARRRRRRLTPAAVAGWARDRDPDRAPARARATGSARRSSTPPSGCWSRPAPRTPCRSGPSPTPSASPPPSIYRHFTDKTHLALRGLRPPLRASSTTSLEAAATGIDDPVEALRRAGAPTCGSASSTPSTTGSCSWARPTTPPSSGPRSSITGLVRPPRSRASQAGIDTGHLVPQTDVFEMALHVWAEHPRPHLAARRPARRCRGPTCDRFIDEHLARSACGPYLPTPR